LAFTEHGAIMAASVLNSPQAVQMSVFVVRAFVRLRGLVVSQTSLVEKLAELERRVVGHDDELEGIVDTRCARRAVERAVPVVTHPVAPPTYTAGCGCRLAGQQWDIPQVFGHTPARESTLRHAHGLKLINVDAGMFELYGGHRVHLEITADDTLVQHSKDDGR
jgi:hypothetical protein